MKIIVVLVLVALFLKFPQFYSQNNPVQDKLDLFIKTLESEGAAVSFKAINLDSENIVAQHNKDMKLPTASIMKLFTTATGFEELGKFYTPTTNFYHDGYIDSNGVLYGNLWVKGGGDPSLGSRYFYKEEDRRKFLYDFVDSILATGIKSINGNVIADGSSFGYKGAPEGWSWGDMGNYYGAGPSGCVLFDNSIYLDFETSKTLNDSTTIICTDPYVDGLNFYNMVKTSKVQRDRAYIFGAPYGLDRVISGTLPFGKESFEIKGSIPDPEKLLAQEVTFELNQKINITGNAKSYREMTYNSPKVKVYEDEKLLFTYPGKTLSTLIYWTNMRSINLFAEQILCHIGLNKMASGSTGSGANYMESYWSKKLNTTIYASDGSGLSRKNAASASDFCELLKYMHKSENFEDYKSTLPVAGKSGTLKSVCRGQTASGRMFAKSGTMTRIKAYSGYVESTSGRKLAFCIIVNNHPYSSYELVKKMEPIFNAMARY